MPALWTQQTILVKTSQSEEKKQHSINDDYGLKLRKNCVQKQQIQNDNIFSELKKKKYTKCQLIF